VIFLHGRLSCIRTMWPTHLNLVFLIFLLYNICKHSFLWATDFPRTLVLFPKPHDITCKKNNP
jgi:hypothetical protein